MRASRFLLIPYSIEYLSNIPSRLQDFVDIIYSEIVCHLIFIVNLTGLRLLERWVDCEGINLINVFTTDEFKAEQAVRR